MTSRLHFSFLSSRLLVPPASFQLLHVSNPSIFSLIVLFSSFPLHVPASFLLSDYLYWLVSLRFSWHVDRGGLPLPFPGFACCARSFASHQTTTSSHHENVGSEVSITH